MLTSVKCSLAKLQAGRNKEKFGCHQEKWLQSSTRDVHLAERPLRALRLGKFWNFGLVQKLLMGVGCAWRFNSIILFRLEKDNLQYSIYW